MPLKFLVDEQLRGVLGRLVRRNNQVGLHPLDVVFVGEPSDLPLGSSDPDILIWAMSADRILVSADKKTMPTHLQDHFAAGHHSPGVMILKPYAHASDVVEFLVVAAYASVPSEWLDYWDYIP